MILEIPITGTVLVKGQVHGDGLLEGDPADPIRRININLGNVACRMIDVDMEREVMIIEVTASDGVDEEIEPGKWIRRKATPAEKQALLEHARSLSLSEKTKDELYALSKSPRLKPFKVESA